MSSTPSSKPGYNDLTPKLAHLSNIIYFLGGRQAWRGILTHTLTYVGIYFWPSSLKILVFYWGYRICLSLCIFVQFIVSKNPSSYWYRSIIQCVKKRYIGVAFRSWNTKMFKPQLILTESKDIDLRIFFFLLPSF